jgi:hypothetical protein
MQHSTHEVFASIMTTKKVDDTKTWCIYCLVVVLSVATVIAIARVRAGAATPGARTRATAGMASVSGGSRPVTTNNCVSTVICRDD